MSKQKTCFDCVDSTFQLLSMDQRKLGELLVAQGYGGKDDPGIREIKVGKGHEVVGPL